MTDEDAPMRLVMTLAEALHATLHAVDPYTAEHSRRVGEFSFEAAVGEILGLTPHQCEGLRVAGCLHDLGKVATPVSILVKPTPLLHEERALIQLHTTQGYEILSPFPWPWPIAEVALQHHERLNGSGYPHGLREDEINPYSRIIAVTDTVESMISHRPYRPSCGLEAALRVINEGAGTLYDSVTVEAVTELLRTQPEWLAAMYA